MIRLAVSPRELTPKVAHGIGLIAPSDFALDAECWRWLPEGVDLFVTRTPKLEDPTVNISQAHKVSDASVVGPAIGSLLSLEPAAIAYACTSGSFVGGIAGERKLQNIMQAAGSARAVTTSGALIMALDAIHAKRVAIATPYTAELTALLVDFVQEAGFEVAASGYLDRQGGIARIKYSAIKRIATLIDRPGADAIFFSCTNLHTFDIIEELEAALGKPVLSANQVTIWAALCLGGLPMPAVCQRLFAATPL